ncbi:hypothetical protein [Ideonella sp.]|uniref:hypothetical protein n=1 Tax=Ideonella sp. TaxID=1929293 RepID=UPI002B49D989|nr:hypothetical protein [Ideonella sp.]HJV69252.1 hypothetical protein [Ideonella sp.]
MLRIALVLGWLVSMSLVGACWMGWQEAERVALGPGDLLVLTVVAAFTPWLAGPALLPWVRRQSQSISLVVTAVFGLATVLWVVALMRAFPKPSVDVPTSEHPKQPRRPQRPGASHH